MRTVLVSVSDKSGLEPFLRGLEKFEPMRLVATGNTAKFLIEKGFTCLKVEELTQFPEILSGRVKTLHPKVFAGILSRPSVEDRTCLKEMEIPEIDVVVVNLYPFEKKLAEGLSEPQMIEHIDIGGVTLLRAAAKNFERVSVVSDPAQYETILESLQANAGKFTDTLRKNLAWQAFQRTAAYDSHISGYLGTRLAAPAEAGPGVPASVQLSLHRHQELRYGENPHQAAAWYAPPSISPELSGLFPPFEQLQGKELSANNIADVYALIRILKDISSCSTALAKAGRARQTGACIIKHNNPCGVAMANEIDSAFDRAYNCDPVSAFGGIYGFTGEVGKALADKIIENFVEVVAAPAFDPGALSVLAKKKNVRVLKLLPDLFATAPKQSLRFKDLQEMGFIVERDLEPPVPVSQFKCVTKSEPDPAMLSDAAFAWSVVRHLTSNAIFVAAHGTSLGFGIGQTNRVGSVKIALGQAGESAKGAVLASDAFFPATDNIDECARAGIKLIVQPGGSIKDEDVIAACNKAGISMLFTGQRCFRH